MTDSQPISGTARDAGDFASANSTSTLFLGNQPKTWMRARGASAAIRQPPFQKLPKLSMSASRRRLVNQSSSSANSGESPTQSASVATAITSLPPPVSDSFTGPSPSLTTSIEQMSPPNAQPTPISRPYSSAQSLTADVSSSRTPSLTQQPPQSSHATAEVPSPSNPRTHHFDSSAGQERLSSPAHMPPTQAIPRPQANHNENLEPLLHHITETIRSRDGQSNFDALRIRFLMEACAVNDGDAILLHQLYMLWTCDTPFVTETLGFEKVLGGMPVLRYILGENTALTPSLAKALSDFPQPGQNLAQAVWQPRVEDIKKTIHQLAIHWDEVCRGCLIRGYPLSPKEIAVTFALRSPRMQFAVFVALCHHMQVFKDRSQGYQGAIIERFLHLQERRAKEPVSLNVENEEWWQIFYKPISDGNPESINLANAEGQRVSSLQNSHYRLPPSNAGGSRQIQRPANPGQHASGPGPAHFVLHNQPNHMNSQSRMARASPQQYAQAPYPNNPLPHVPSQRGQLQQGQSQQHPHTGHRPTQAQYQPPLLGVHPQQYAQNFAIPNGHLSPGPQNGWVPTQQNMQMSFSQHQGAVQGYVMADGQMHAAQMQSAHQQHALMPPPNFTMPQAVTPNPDRVALHQAHVRSPVARTVDLTNKPDPNLLLYQVTTNLVLKPQALGHDTRYATFQVEISREDSDRKLIYTPPPHQSLHMGSNMFKQGSLRWRFKCVAREAKEAAPPGEADFCARSTYWPQHLFVSFNQLDDVTLRRKPHYGRDLPADLTEATIAGTNTLTFSYDQSPMDRSQQKAYWIAVERVEIFEHSQLLQSINTQSSSDSLTRILDSMKGDRTDNADDDNDDIEITNPTIGIDVTDPFSAQLWKTPVRSASCKHRECFDLDTFMSSRRQLRAQLAGPAGADDWRCPHCKRDARPQHLIVDGFLQAVREELERTGNLNVKVILVKDDGTWEAKIEPDDEVAQARGKSTTPAGNPDGAGDARQRLERSASAMDVVSLDDDD